MCPRPCGVRVWLTSSLGRLEVSGLSTMDGLEAQEKADADRERCIGRATAAAAKGVTLFPHMERCIQTAFNSTTPPCVTEHLFLSDGLMANCRRCDGNGSGRDGCDGAEPVLP